MLRDPNNASIAHFSIIWRDALSVPAPPWPGRPGTCGSPSPSGSTRTGTRCASACPSGTSCWGANPERASPPPCRLLIAAAALDPSVHLTLLDGKQVELAPWSGSAEHFVGPDMEGAIGVLKDLCAEMDRRYATLLAAGLRKIEPGGEFGLHVVAIDELAFYMRGGKRDERNELTETLRDLISRGRAAGIIVIAATQKPSNEIIPTFVRDLFSFRMALRCTTPEASDTVLGQGWASQGYSASTLDPTARGVGFLLAEGAVPVKIRTHYLADDDIAALAKRAEALAAPDEVGRGVAGDPGRGRTRPAAAPIPIRLRGILLERATGELVETGTARPVQGPAGRRLPVVLPPLPSRRLAAGGRRHPGRKGRQPRRGPAPSALRHPDRSLLRAGAQRARSGTA